MSSGEGDARSMEELSVIFSVSPSVPFPSSFHGMHIAGETPGPCVQHTSLA